LKGKPIVRILTAITYYRPHTSGLTIYAERLARALAHRGHAVTVLTSQYENGLPREEVVDGVRIVRAPVLFRISKGVIMPTFGLLASKLVMEHDVIQLHLPQFDAAGLALRGRLLRKPTVLTYHCDLRMPPGLLSLAANQAVLLMNELAAFFTHRIVTYTQDYAEHSPYISRHMDKLRVINPPVVLPETTPDALEAFRAANNPGQRKPVIGMASRFATEKGVEILLNAMPRLIERFPDLQVQFAGPYGNIIGEEDYFARLEPTIRKYQESGYWRFLGNLNPQQMANYYPNLDVLVMPSLNSTEAFGLVQIEAMMNGVPSVASDLPGVRQPALRHRMGKIIPIGDADALAAALLEIFTNPAAYRQDAAMIARQYVPDHIAAAYEDLFTEMLDELKQAKK
jgi:glycosyltransferase involved in cell wall biosynthesis